MTDRQSTFKIAFDGDASDLNSVLSALKRSVSSATSELERTTGRVELFKNTEAQAAAAAKKFDDLSARAAEFRQQIAQIEGNGGKVGKELTEALKLTEKQIAATSKEYNRQADALKRLSGQLEKAGVDTARLADEEARLAAATKAAAAAQEQQAARTLLGVRSTQQVQAEVQKLNAAYQLLRKSGTASSDELAAAHRNLAQRVKELDNEHGALGQTLANARGQFLAVGAALAGVAAAYSTVVARVDQYEASLARIRTVSTTTDAQLDELGKGVQSLAKSLGFDLQEGLNAVYELLRRGVPKDNVLDVLGKADAIAKVGLTDLGTAAKLAGTLVRGFGIEAANLTPALDAIFVSARQGGATFAEMADGLGAIAPLARATRTPLAEVVVAIQQMVQAGLDAPTAFGQLTQIMTRLADRDTQQKLRELGIEASGLVGTLQQLADRGIPIDEVLELGISSARAATGVAALTSNAQGLATAMVEVGNSSGEFTKAADELDKTRGEAVQRLTAALNDLVLTLGKVVAPSAATVNALALLVSTLSKAVELAGNAAKWFGIFGLNMKLTSLAAEAAQSDIRETAQVSEEASKTITEAEKRSAEESARASATRIASLTELRAELVKLIPVIVDGSKAIQQAAAQSIADVSAQAQQQIAALDKVRLTEQQLAQETVAIQKKAADERLAILQKSSTDALAAASVEADARRAAAGRTKNDLLKVENEIATSKRGMLDGIVKGYQSHVNDLLAIANDARNKMREIDRAQLAFNQSIEDRVRDIRRQGLTEYEKYQDTITRIDEAIARSRDELTKGNVENAKKFADKAIELATTVSTEVRSGQEVVVTASKAQEIAITKIEVAQELVNVAFDEGRKAAAANAEATRANLEEASRELSGFKSELDGVNAALADGIDVVVNTNAKEVVDAARAEIMSLDGIQTTSTHTIVQRTVEARAAGGLIGEGVRNTRSASRAIRNVVQQFANGGAVFRRPAWSRVPGAGNQDTVPAALQAGSFVVKKAASRYYGDGVMRALAGGVRGYALGGPVSPLLGAVDPKSMLAHLGSGGELWDIIREAFLVFQPLIDGAKTLPRSDNGQNLADYLVAVLDLIRSATDVRSARELLDNIASIAGNLAASISQAHRTNVPIVMGATATEAAASGPSDLYNQLVEAMRQRRYASGGAARGTDTVPAMLTPGEYVINRRAVDHFGAGLMHAINQMRIPKSSLAGMLAPPQVPRYLADGGSVVASSGGSSASTPATPGGGSSVTVNLTASAEDLYSKENVRRFLVPVLRDLERRSS